MADTTAKTATTPRRRTSAAKTTGTAAKATTRKPAPKPAAKAEEPVEEEAPTTDGFVVELEYHSDTKSYAKFVVPANLNGTMVGSIYAPLGTDTVKVKITGVEDDE